MPIKIKDEEGNEVEVFTQEDVDSVLTEKLEAQKQTLVDEFDAKLKENNPPAADPVKNEGGETQPQADEPPQWFKDWATQQEQTINSLKTNQSRGVIDSVVSGLDADKQKDVRERYEALSGYEETPEGMEQRANDAYLLVVGERPQASGVNMQNLAAAGGRPSQQKEEGGYSEQDKQLQSALGITEEDAQKYGNNKQQ